MVGGAASPPSRAAWIEISPPTKWWGAQRRRLHGRRGLKWVIALSLTAAASSPPSRAAWIEIRSATAERKPRTSPPSRAAWIEIICPTASRATRRRRRLHGRRGLKCIDDDGLPMATESPPSRAAWIEIAVGGGGCAVVWSPPSRAAWIEIPLSAIISAMYRSLHSQVVWIEAFPPVRFAFAWNLH